MSFSMEYVPILLFVLRINEIYCYLFWHGEIYPCVLGWYEWKVSFRYTIFRNKYEP